MNDTTVVAAIDFLPTLSAIIGSKTTARTDGEDMSGAWMGAGMSRKEPVFWRWRWQMPPQLYHRSPALAMRQGHWKLLMNPDGSRVELYNLSADPTELDNLSREYPQIVQQMQKALLEWHKAPAPGKVPGKCRPE